jgi:tetratricopeptide (TPR) repeat protein
LSGSGERRRAIDALDLAQCLDALGATEEAVGHYQALLRLNPGDNQGARFILVPKLIELGHDAAALKVLDEYGDSPMAASLYSRALLTFRAEGDSPAARASLREARRANPHVAKYLRAESDLPDGLPSAYSIGSEEEAVIYVTELFKPWHATPGAVEWLDGQERDAARRKRKRQTTKRRKKRGK